MKARFVYESVSFERGKTPKDSMRIGRKYFKELEIDGVYTVSGTGDDLEIFNNLFHHRLEGYDEKKFLSNCESGFYPMNLGVRIKGRGYIIPSDRLKDRGIEQLVYNDEIIELG